MPPTVATGTTTVATSGVSTASDRCPPVRSDTTKEPAITPVHRILLVAIAAVVMGVVVPPPGAHACSCVEPTRADVAEWLDSADAAFVGTPTARTEPTPGPDGTMSSDQEIEMTFAVASVAKGEMGREVVIATAADGASCGLEGAGRMAVLLRGSAEFGWASDLCSVVPVETLAELADLRDPSEQPTPPVAAATASPTPPASPPASPPADDVSRGAGGSTSGPTSGLPGWLAIGVVLVLAGALVLRRRRA